MALCLIQSYSLPFCFWDSEGQDKKVEVRLIWLELFAGILKGYLLILNGIQKMK